MRYITGTVFLIFFVSSIMHGVAFYVNLAMNKCLVNNHFVCHRLTLLQDIDWVMIYSVDADYLVVEKGQFLRSCWEGFVLRMSHILVNRLLCCYLGGAQWIV
jgi:hypothetical protein